MMEPVFASKTGVGWLDRLTPVARDWINSELLPGIREGYDPNRNAIARNLRLCDVEVSESTIGSWVRRLREEVARGGSIQNV